MIPTIGRYCLTACIATVLWLCNGGISSRGLDMVATAAAVVGAPATPVSYAGVARRSPVGVGSAGVGVTPGVGVGAPGVAAAPGVGAPGAGATPAPGVNTPANQGGPVNRVGRR